MQLDWIIDNVTTISPISLIITLATISVTIVYYAFKSRGLPPGPTGVPILGYWPFLNEKTCHLHLEELKKRYGDVFSFTVTGTLYINLGSTKVIREAHATKADCFDSRTTEYNIARQVFEHGIFSLNGEPWKALRKFFILTLKERGMTSAKDNMTGALYDSINSTIEYLYAKNGEPDAIGEFLTDKCNAILRHTLFGDSVTEEQIREINLYHGDIAACMTPTTMLLTGNIAKFLFYFMPSVRNGLASNKRQKSLIYKIIDDHKSSYDEGNIRDLIDEYFKERVKRRCKGDPTAQYFTDQALMSSLMQFISDGVLSVAVFIAFFLKTATDFPEEQEKLYEEIVEVVGLDRQPTVEDKSKLTYMNAFMLEVLRQLDFFPFIPSLACTKETTIRGYRIPVGAITIMNIWSSHFDSEIYEEPEKFNPSRFISAEGKKRPELPVFFGVGRRACMGESFTMIQVFLFLATILQKFRLSLPAGSSKGTSFELLFSGNLKICAHPRNKK